MYDAANDNTDTCNDALLAELQARLLARQDRLVLVNERILVVSGNLDGVSAREASVATRKAELEAILAGVNPTNTDRIASLTERIATLETRLTDLESRITNLETRIEDLNARVTRLEAAIVRISERIDRVQARCDAGTGGGTTTAQLYFLHSDHLGKTQFATDSTGTVVWDGGINTPFGESVTLASAFAQNLMFPGQYRDDESGLSHNWHRTYDPTLGRYLQSDPIGLAGGINRYAYVGGNPTGTVDPTGEFGLSPGNPFIQGVVNTVGRVQGSALGSSATMSVAWATGTGPDHWTFGPNSPHTNNLKGLPAVLGAIELYNNKNNGNTDNCDCSTLKDVTNYASGFGLGGYATATKKKNSTWHFVGSFRVEVFPVDCSNIKVEITNTSSFKSFAYGIAPAWERSTFGPMGNMDQTYWWTQPRR